MSSNKQHSFSTFNSASYSSSSVTSNTAGDVPQTTSYSEMSARNPSGTTIQRTSQQPGEEPRTETTRYDAQGRLEPAAQTGDSGDSRGRIEDVTDADREYEERIEDEYAKREGGA